MRYSNKQLALYNTINALLSLYASNKFRDAINSGKRRYVGNEVAKFLLNIFSYSVYNHRENTLLLSKEVENRSATKPLPIEMSSGVTLELDQVDLCMDWMRRLHGYIVCQEYDILKIVETIEERGSESIIDISAYKMLNFPDVLDKCEFDKCKSFARQSKASNDDDVIHKHHYVPQKYYWITSDMQLARLLILMEPTENEFFIIPDITNWPWSSFTQIFRSLIITYHYEFGNLAKIKACKQCGKMFIEKQTGMREYCSPACRKKIHTLSLNPNTTKCLQRQNAFINYHFRELTDKDKPRPHLIYIEDCNDCAGRNNLPKGGHCRILIERNTELLKLIFPDKGREGFAEDC